MNGEGITVSISRTGAINAISGRRGGEFPDQNIDPWELLNAVTSVRCALKSKLKWTGDILL